MIAYILQQITIIESQFKFEHYYVLQHKKYEFEYPWKNRLAPGST